MNRSRTALVTGSAQGIGAAIRTALQRSGHTVIGIDLKTDEDADKSIVADLGVWSEVQRAIRDIEHVDILVNNAAILSPCALGDLSESDLVRPFAVNLNAAVLLTKTWLPGMVDRSFGRVINVSSAGARTGGLRETMVYASTKAALQSITRNLARHYVGDGVTANCVLPGAIETPLSRYQRRTGMAAGAAFGGDVPVGRWGTPDEISSVVAFLASTEAGFVNGAMIDASGGLVCGS